MESDAVKIMHKRYVGNDKLRQKDIEIARLENKCDALREALRALVEAAKAVLNAKKITYVREEDANLQQAIAAVEALTPKEVLTAYENPTKSKEIG